MLTNVNSPLEWLKINPRGFLYSATGARQIFLFVAEKEDVTFPVWVGGNQGWPGRGDQVHSSLGLVRHKILKKLNYTIDRCLFTHMNGHQIQAKLILKSKSGEEIVIEDTISSILPLCLSGTCEYFTTRELISQCRSADLNLHQMEFSLTTGFETENKILM